MSEVVAFAKLKNIRVSPRKMRAVASLIQGKGVFEALSFLENTRRSANPYLRGLIKSALSNAEQANSETDTDKLKIKRMEVNAGRTLKRIRPRAMGRGATIRKRSSHIYLGLGY